MNFFRFLIFVIFAAVVSAHSHDTPVTKIDGKITSLLGRLESCGDSSPLNSPIKKLLRALRKVADVCISEIESTKNARIEIEQTPADPLQCRSKGGIVAFAARKMSVKDDLLRQIGDCCLPIAADADGILFGLQKFGCGDVDNFLKQINKDPED